MEGAACPTAEAGLPARSPFRAVPVAVVSHFVVAAVAIAVAVWCAAGCCGSLLGQLLWVECSGEVAP